MANASDWSRALAPYARPLSLAMSDFDAILERVGTARCVMIGEASHGTHEFYRQRAQLTKRLLVEKGFNAVAAEADWPDAYRVNRYVRGLGTDPDAAAALQDFQCFPAWMWRNADVLDFVGWLRDFNDARPDLERVGFYGLDLYSLQSSIAAVLAYLDTVDPEAASRARQRYACFDHYGADPQVYGFEANLGLSPGCERAVIDQLIELHAERARWLERDGAAAADEHFQAEQNARVVADAESYYRSMFRSSVESWNLRDRHMADTLDNLLQHLPGESQRAKVVVWAHNSHVGDARATELGREGELNIGQLARERHPGQVFLVGFTTYEGTVTAASDWGKPAQRRGVRPALAGSYEAAFHALQIPAFLLTLADLESSARALLEVPRLQRAIGVVYRPDTERLSHYYHAQLAQQFDALIHIDHTRALEPLEALAPLARDDSPETYPSGF